MITSSPAVRTWFPAFPQSPRSISPWRILHCIAAALLGAALATGACAQSTSTKVTGSYYGSLGGNTSVKGEFSCTGTPTCTGQYREEYRSPSCTNSLVASAGITISGLNLGQSGALQGSILLKAWDFSWNQNTDGSCTIIPGSYDDFTVSYTGNWNLATGTGSFNILFWEGATVPGTFKADVGAAPPVFSMVVRSSIDSVRATAAADIQFRPQDVGTSGSIYTFAVAPANLVKGGLEKSATVVGQGLAFAKADAPTCVVAQLNSSGQLIAVTTAQLQAYSSGALSANGASVTILNNASTPAVAGATFYVGYGGSSSSMVTNGVYRPAVTVPGTSVCPMLSSQTAMWWNPAEVGWGINLAHQGNILFGALFTYDATGAPLWLVMSNGVMQSDGATFTGDLYRNTGPAFNADPFTPLTPANYTKVGTMTVSFVDVNSGTLRYTVNNVEVSKGIQRFVYGSRAASCLPTTASRAAATNYQDLWWKSDESGWGLNLTHQDNTLFATLFTYDATGRDLWLLSGDGLRLQGGVYSGPLHRAAGPPFNASPWVPNTATPVGTMSVQFSDGEHGTLEYTYNGARVRKPITRVVFQPGITVPDCK